MGRLLIVTAVDTECGAVGNLPGATAVAGGAGPVAAAVATAAVLAQDRYDLVLSAGIAGGFPPAEIGSVVIARRIAFADLGAETPEGFVALSTLGFGTNELDVDEAVADDLVRRTGGLAGTVLTVSTVTGAVESAAELARRYPDALAEGMEGFGVAAAARQYGVPFGEVRAISNMVGPRRRDAWDIPAALDALRAAFKAITA